MSENGTNKTVTFPGWPEWMDLKTLARYSSVSIKTIHRWMTAESDPLPASKPSGKVLVKRKTFDLWMERQSGVENMNVSDTVDSILKTMARS